MGGTPMERLEKLPYKHTKLCPDCDEDFRNDKVDQHFVGVLLLVVCYAYSLCLFILAAIVSYAISSIKQRLLDQWRSFLATLPFTTVKSSHIRLPRKKLNVGQR